MDSIISSQAWTRSRVRRFILFCLRSHVFSMCTMRTIEVAQHPLWQLEHVHLQLRKSSSLQTTLAIRHFPVSSSRTASQKAIGIVVLDPPSMKLHNTIHNILRDRWLNLFSSKADSRSAFRCHGVDSYPPCSQFEVIRDRALRLDPQH